MSTTFKRYTEEARRVVFYSCYEATRRDSQSISAQCIVLGLMREWRSGPVKNIEFRERMEAHIDLLQLPPAIHSKIALKDLPLDGEAKKALSCAVNEADNDKSRRIEPEHLLRGLLCFENGASDVLKAAGFELESIREVSNAGDAKGRFLRRLRWEVALMIEEAFQPAPLHLAIILAVGLLMGLLIRWLGMR